MSTQVFKIREQKVVADYATSFIDEGYFIVVKMESVSLMFYHLRHRYNGNNIIIHAEPLRNMMWMKKNGIIKVVRSIIKKHGK